MKVDWAWIVILMLAVIVGKMAYENRLKSSSAVPAASIAPVAVGPAKTGNPILDYITDKYPNAR